ncbi:MAG: hypothetical protein ABI864_01155 [Chloroflexota bacterium]
MTTTLPVVTDALIEEMLRRRSTEPDAALLGQVLQLVDAKPQRAGRHWSPARLPGRTLALIALLVLLAAMAGAAIIGAFTPNPEPPSAMPRYHHNGSILVMRQGIPLQVVNIGAESPAAKADLPYNGKVDRISWSPDGMQLVYARPDGVWIADLRSGERRNVVECGDVTRWCIAAWSPNGAAIAVVDGSQIRLIAPDGMPGASFAPVVDDIFSLTWSPDGKRLAFVTNGFRDFTSSTMYVVNRDGSDLRAVPDAVLPDRPIFDLAWAPDGSRIAYIAAVNVFTSDAGWTLELATINPDGTKRTVLAPAGSCFCLGFGPSGLAWSPDGKLLALGKPGLGLFILDASGSKLAKVSDLWEYPAWRPVP